MRSEEAMTKYGGMMLVAMMIAQASCFSYSSRFPSISAHSS